MYRCVLCCKLHRFCFADVYRYVCRPVRVVIWVYPLSRTQSRFCLLVLFLFFGLKYMYHTCIYTYVCVCVCVCV